jgi:hypothetical protein
MRVIARLVKKHHLSQRCEGAYLTRRLKKGECIVLSWDVNTLFHELLHDQQYKKIINKDLFDDICTVHGNDPFEILADRIANELNYLYQNGFSPIFVNPTPLPNVCFAAIQLQEDCSDFHLNT